CSNNVRKTHTGRVDKKQKTIVFGSDSESDPNKVSMKLVNFNQEHTLIALAKMIIIDALAFKFFENEGFRKFMEDAQPKFKIPSYVIIARHCMHVFNDEKEKLKHVLFANKQMVSLSTNTWTLIQNMNYMCVIAHHIDEG
ncbi:Putative AC transposase, partial [Glycine soja]